MIKGLVTQVHHIRCCRSLRAAAAMPHAAAQICADVRYLQHSAVGLQRMSRRPFSKGPPLHSAASPQWQVRNSPWRQRACAQASRLQGESSATQEQDIEGLDRNYCESFHFSPMRTSMDSVPPVRLCPGAEGRAYVTAPAVRRRRRLRVLLQPCGGAGGAVLGARHTAAPAVDAPAVHEGRAVQGGPSGAACWLQAGLHQHTCTEHSAMSAAPVP